MDKRITIAGKTIQAIEHLKERYQMNENMDSGWSQEEASSIRAEAMRILFALTDFSAPRVHAR